MTNHSGYWPHFVDSMHPYLLPPPPPSGSGTSQPQPPPGVAYPTQPIGPAPVEVVHPAEPVSGSGATDCWHAPRFVPADAIETPTHVREGKGRTVVVSDVHIGNGGRTCWYQRPVHEPYLAAIFDYVVAHADVADPVTELVLLGDFFDFWTYPPDQHPPSMDEIVAANGPILGEKGKLREAVEALDGNVIFLRGNHDITVTQDDLDRLPMGDHRIRLADGLIEHRGVVLTHGHLFTMFNAPDVRYPDEVPVGHFVSRAIAHYLESTLAPGQTAADLRDQGSPYGFDLASFLPALGELLTSPSVADTLLTYIANRCSLSEDAPIRLADGSETTIAKAKQKYDGLWTIWVERHGGGQAGQTLAAKSAQADYDGTYMAWFAQKAAFEHGTRGVMTGHTHWPKEGIVNSRTCYVNCGFECPSAPDLAEGRTRVNFGVIASNGTPELWTVSDEGSSYCVKHDRTAPPDRTVFAPFEDFSCYVTIHNEGPDDLEKVSEQADNGFYVSAPPHRIAARETAQIWLQDLAGIHGAEGSVTYRHTGNHQTIEFSYGCPTGIFSNYASGGSSFVASSGAPPTANTPPGAVPSFGHPLFVDFTVTEVLDTAPGDWTPRSLLAHAVVAAGFSYDPRQDIIYSRMYPLQRHFGYGYGYDAAALAMNAIIDCEPIFFDYGGKSWMIELWKGQYGLETGCEIGVYNRAGGPSSAWYSILDATIGQRPGDPNPAHNRFFDCANDNELLRMSWTLYKNGSRLFSRGPERHWWLTGFKWGVISEPEELTMDISIECLDAAMTTAFTGALASMGYTGVQTIDNTVSFVFGAPKAPQPRASVPHVVAGVRAANQAIVTAYNSLGLTNNDPNTVGDQAAATIGTAFALYSDQFFASVLANLARQFGLSVEAAVRALTDAFGIAFDEAAQLVNNVGYTLSQWVAGIGNFIEDAFDFSCVVEISNRGGPFELIRNDYGIISGNWAVLPPERIPPGGIGRCWLKDPKPSTAGSEGWVTYRYVDGGGVTRLVRCTFADPTGWSQNVVTVSSPSFAFYTKSTNVNNAWSALNQQTPWGHPLFAAFSWAGLPPPI
jgi:UDP-2,3-diacylglucosamine pyrophosphatase LpxH